MEAAFWMSEFEDSLTREFGDKPRIMTLANIDHEGLPQARSVICRRVESAGALWFCCDARSAKVLDLEQKPAVACTFWLESLRLQYRLTGEALGWRHGEFAKQRMQIWQDLSDRSRAMFYWPPPGTPRTGEASPSAESPTNPLPPDTLAVFRIDVQSVDLLDLNPHPHRRRRCTYQKDRWICDELNP